MQNQPHNPRVFRRRLPARYAGIVLPFVLSALMSCIVSGISTVKAAGLSEGVMGQWMSAWGVSWVIAFPTLILVLPVVRRIVGWLVEQPVR